MPNFDMGKAIADASGRYAPYSANSFHFLVYAKSYCMQHILWAAKLEPSFTKLLLRLLSKSIIDADAAMEFNMTPLSLAAWRGHEAVVKLVLETNMVDVEAKDRTYGWTPLLSAAKNGHEAVVKLLLETKLRLTSTRRTITV